MLSKLSFHFFQRISYFDRVFSRILKKIMQNLKEKIVSKETPILGLWK
ncbi:hypothetical protein D351_00942 [Enterococcus faecalis WKS-26-18-2]|nr:hypothetical protein D351_00942 [Enterococcus faecalis WKS-26-18-2]